MGTFKIKIKGTTPTATGSRFRFTVSNSENKKRVEAYAEAIEKQAANQKAYDDLLNFDVNAGQDEISGLEAMLKKANELILTPPQTKKTATATRNGVSYTVDEHGNYSIAPATNDTGYVRNGVHYNPNVHEKKDDAALAFLKENGYSSVDELRNAINQKKQYLNDAKSTQSTHAALSKYNKTQEENGEEINSLYTDMGTKKANYEENGKSPLDWISKGIAAFMYGDSPKNIAVSNEESEYMSASEKYYTAKYGTKAEQQELLNIFKQSGDSKYSQEIKELTHSLYGDSAFDEYIVGNIEAGTRNFFYETAATFNAITSLFGLPIDGTKAYQDLKKSAEAQNTYASNAAIALGDVNNKYGNLIQVAITFIPDLILTVATKGSSGSGATTKSLIKIANAGIKAQKTASITNKFLKYGSEMLDAVNKGISATAKNPMFWTSFSRTFGTDYETALEGGADTATAYLYATITSITNALVEIGGGVEKRLPDVISGKSKFQILDWVKEAIEEGNEEVIQGVITNLNQILYDSDKEFFSLENEDAIINPRRMLREHAMGTLGGAVLGGGTKIGQRIISGSTRGITLAGKSAIRNNIVSDLAEFCRTAADENVRAVSESFLTTGKITNYDAGVLFAHAQKQINYDLNLAKTPAKTRAAIKKYIKGNYPEAIKQMVIGNEIAKMYDISGIARKVSQREYSFSTNGEDGGIINSTGQDSNNNESAVPLVNNNSQLSFSPEQKEASVLKYKSSESYMINAKLREDIDLTDEEQVFVNTLDEALLELPIYEGTVYRQIIFDDFGEEAFNQFLQEHIPNKPIFYKQFISCSTTEDGYTVEWNYKVQLIVEGKNARNVDGYGNNMEKEVIFPRDSVFIVKNINTNGQHPIIHLQEDFENGYNTFEKPRDAVRNMQKPYFGDSNLQGISEKNTDRNIIRQVRPQSSPSAGQRDNVRTGRRQETLLSTETNKQVNDFSFSVPKSIYTEPDLTTEKPQTFEELAVKEVFGDREYSIEVYSEEQYNNFGWVRYNDVLTASEYSALMSNYTGHKHKDDSFPITRFGETVIHSFQHPRILMYVKGNIRTPQITKVVHIDAEDGKTVLKIKENILKNERAQVFQPYSFVRDYYGERILIVDRKRDYASFQEYKRGREGSFGEKDYSFDRNERNGTRGTNKSEANNGQNKITVVNPESQVRGTPMISEPDLTAQKPQTLEERTMANIAGGDALLTDGQRRVNGIARLLKMEPVWDVEGDPEVVGKGYYENGVIHLNKQAPALTTVYLHEFCHHLQRSGNWNAFVSFARNTPAYAQWICEKGGSNDFTTAEANYKAQIKKTYESKTGSAYNDTRLTNEIMARFISEKMMTEYASRKGKDLFTATEHFLTEIAKHRKWYHIVMDWISEMINRLTRRHEQADFLKFQRMLKQAYNDVQSRAAQVDEVREYDINQNFYSEFDSWDGKDTNRIFTIGTTSEALKSVNIKNQEIKMRSGMILQKLSKHPEMSRQIFRDIPELLEHPVIIQFSDAIDPNTGKPKYDSRITVMGELYADMVIDGKTVKKPVLVSLELLPTNQKKTKILDVSFVTSAYTKNTLQQYINENSILYIDPNKKRTQNWLSLNRLQLPLGENQTGPIRRITYIGEKVKIENSTKKTDIQLALEKAGVIDSYGNSIFKNSHNDTSKSKENFENRDYFFEDDKANSEDIYFEPKKEHATDIINKKRDIAETASGVNKNSSLSPTKNVNTTDSNGDFDLKQIRAEEREKFEAAAQRRTDLDVIKRTVNRIDTKLRQNSNAKHVPKELRKAAIEFCSIFAQNDTSVFDSTKIWNVRKLYDALLKKQKENGYGNADPDILEDIQYIGDVMQNRRLISLNKTERETVRRIAEHLEHLINKTNEIFIEEKKLEASKVAEAEIERLGKKSSKTYLNLGDGALRRSVDKGKEFLHVGNKKPIFFFEEVSGVLEKLYKDISNGFDKAIFNLKECSEQLQGIIKKHDYKNWLKDKKAKHKATRGGLVLKKKDGQQITVAPEQVMSIYAIHLREEANQDTKGTNHLKQGGIVLATREIIQQIKGDTKQNKKESAENTLDKMIKHGWFTAWASKPYRIDDNDIKQIKEYLGKDGMAFVEEMVHWLSTVGAQLGNEASMKLYNINKFGENYYFPIETSSDYLARQVSEKKGNKTLAGSSFAKTVTEKANTPIVVGNFLDICADHMIAMCAYNALTVPIDNFKRIWSYTADGENGEAAVSLRSEIKRIFGQEYVDYIDQFIKDVDGGIDGQQPGDSLAAELIGKFKKNAVVAKLSVAIQQPSSLLRAMAYIEPKYFLNKITSIKETWKECMKYNSVAIQKEIGRFDVGNPKSARDYMLGTEYNGAKEKIDGFLHDENYRDDVLGKGPEFADKITWCIIWNGCKAKARDMLVSRVKEAKIDRNGIKRFDSSNVDTESNMRKIAKMSSVYNVQSEKLKKTGKKPSELFSDFFDSLGNEIFVEQFGKISLPKSSVKSEIRHGITAEKLASIEAIPDVLKNGEVIFAETKPDSDVERIVVCAPITIGNEPYYMGVMLQRDSQMQRLYLHNVVIEKEMPGTSQADLLTTGALEDTRHLFMTSILQKAVAVKNKYMQNPDAYSTNQINFEEQVKLEAAKLFKEVIEHTQVYDSVLSRSQNMRSKSRWTQIVTSFMGEPTVNLNLLLRAVSEFKNGNKKFAGKIVGSIVASTLLNALLKSLVTALGDDDEDKSYGEKYVTDVGQSFWGDIWPHTWVPLISDVDSIWKGYKIERADITLVQDLYNGLNSLDNDKKSTWDKILGIAAPLSSMTGVPVGNIARDIGNFVKTVSHALNDDLEHTHGLKYAFNEGMWGEKKLAEYYEIMRDKQKKGDTQGYTELKEYLMGRGKTEKEIESGVKAAYSKSKAVTKQTDDYFAKLAQNALFGKLPDEKQEDVKTAVKRYLTESAMKDATEREMSKTNQKAAEAQKNGSSAVNYFLAKASFEDTDNSGGISKEEKIAAINKMNISALEKQVLIMLYTKK